jgi:hypothetical protein
MGRTESFAVAVGFCTKAKRSPEQRKWDFLELPARCPSLPLCRLGTAVMFAKKKQPPPPPEFLGSSVAFENVVSLVCC